MKSHIALIVAALAAAANAVQFTNSAINPEPGKPFELTWSDAQGSVTVNLKTGPSTQLTTVEELVSGSSESSLSITLDPADYPSGTYAFEIIDSTDPNKPNYSEQFAFQGTGAPLTLSGTPSPTATPTATRPSTSDTSTSKVASTESETGSKTTASRPSRTSSDEEEEEETDVPGAAGRVASPLALILGAVAAMVYFN